MSKFDGTDEPLSYGQAIAELVARCSWPSEGHRDEVRDTILKEHNLYREPEPVVEPEDVAREKELAELREQLAALRKDKATRDRDDELAALKAEIAAAKSGDGVYDGKSREELRALAAERGLGQGGTKDELIARLEESDKVPV